MLGIRLQKLAQMLPEDLEFRTSAAAAVIVRMHSSGRALSRQTGHLVFGVREIGAAGRQIAERRRCRSPHPLLCKHGA